MPGENPGSPAAGATHGREKRPPAGRAKRGPAACREGFPAPLRKGPPRARARTSQPAEPFAGGASA
eukprot:787906-Lingulodinium_polyedra.AAC.1